MMMATHKSCLAATDIWCGKKRCALWQDKMSVVTRRDLCCGKTQGNHKGRRPPKAASLVSCHHRGLVLPQQATCVATAHLSSRHTRNPSYRLSATTSVPMFLVPGPGFGPWSQLLVSGPWSLVPARVLVLVAGFWGGVWGKVSGQILCSRLNLHNSTLVAPFGASMGAK